MGQERQMTSYLRNLQLEVCCERAPPSDCSEKYCSGYSVLHFSPKPRFYTEDSQRFTELCPHNIFQKYGLLSNFCWTHTHSGLHFVSWGQCIKVRFISAGLYNTTASSVPHFWDPEPVAPLFILQKGAPKIWRIEKEAHTYILYSSNFFQSSEIHLALVTIWPLP